MLITCIVFNTKMFNLIEIFKNFRIHVPTYICPIIYQYYNSYLPTMYIITQYSYIVKFAETCNHTSLSRF